MVRSPAANSPAVWMSGMSISLSVGRLSCRLLVMTVVGVRGRGVSVVFGFGKDAPGLPVGGAAEH